MSEHLDVLHRVAGCIRYGTGNGYRRLTGEVADVLRPGHLGRPGVLIVVVGRRGPEEVPVGMNLDSELGSRIELELEVTICIETVGISGQLLRRITRIHGHDGDTRDGLGVTIGNRPLDGGSDCTGGDSDIKAILPGCGLGVAGGEESCGLVVEQQTAFAGRGAVGGERCIDSELDLEENVVVAVINGCLRTQCVVIEDNGYHAVSKIWIGVMRSLGQRDPAALDGTHSHGTPTGLVIRELQADTLVALAALDTGGLCVQGELLPGDIGANSVRHQFSHAPERRR